ncbi:hypothetical protein EGW08_011753 [Elysia chlorotica]|uniref:Uncharacterized protein n=1 Tax=Elysia chlorotica TaxID=188477 RepID=A0A433TFX3_ELYCH|nr:hypothetical protein EGW08_011753 [Elysia chlorotica]
MSTARSTSEADLSMPFKFYNATSNDKFDAKALKAFLQERGLYNRGLWRHMCSKTRPKGLKFGSMFKDSNLFVLSKESGILQKRRVWYSSIGSLKSSYAGSTLRELACVLQI